MIATRTYLDGLAHALTDQTGITIVSGDEWKVDKEKNILQYKQDDILLQPIRMIRGLILSIIGRMKYTKVQPQSEIAKEYPQMYAVYDMVEDMRIIRELINDHGDFSIQALSNYYSYKIDEFYALPFTSPPEKAHELADRLQLLQHYFYSLHEDFLSSLTYDVIENGEAIFFSTGSYPPYYNKKSVEFYGLRLEETKTWFGAHRGEFNSLQRRFSLCINTKMIVSFCDKEIFPLIEDVLEKGKGAGQGFSMASPGSADGESGKSLIPTIPGAGPALPEHPKLSSVTLEEIDGMLWPYINSLAYKLDAILRERRSSRFRGLKKTGKLLGKNAYRILTDETRIFSRKTVQDKTDYAITIIFDESGSMNYEDIHGKRYENTFIGGRLLQVVSQKLKFPVTLIGFSDRVVVYKDIREYIDDFEGGDNNDAGALRLAEKYVDPDRENIIFMLGDGGICTDITGPLKRLHDKGVSVIGVGVGVMTDELIKAYGTAINVPNVSELPMKLIDLLKTLIHR